MPVPKVIKPVTFPPGRARLSASPAATGSAAAGNTIGTVRVRRNKGPTVELPVATMTSGASATSSAAYLRVFSGVESGPPCFDPYIASGPLARAPGGTLRARIEIPRRPGWPAAARQCAASVRLAAPAPRAATLPRRRASQGTGVVYVEHGLLPGTRWASLPQGQVASEAPLGP